MKLAIRGNTPIITAILVVVAVSFVADASAATPPPQRVGQQALATSPVCPIGWFDGANCQMGVVPAGSKGFVYNGQLYYNAVVQQSCPQAGSWWDGAHCYLQNLPAGTTAFVWNSNLYYNYVQGPVRCPMQGSWDDSAHCYVNHPSGSAV